MKRIMTVTMNPCLDKTIELEAFCEGGLNRARSVRTDAGGKGINVAKVLRRFDCDVLATGVMGSRGGEPLFRELEERDIACHFVSVPGVLRTNYKLFDSAKGQVTEVNEPGFSVDSEQLKQLFALIEGYLPETAVLVLAGSLAPGMPADIYKRLIELAKARQVQVILDADGGALTAGLEAAPHAIKPNIFELEQLHGAPFQSEAALLDYARQLLSTGIGLIVLSMGADGALYMTEQEAWRIRLVPIACKSTVGAGDSMVAATACSLLRGTGLKGLAVMASAAGTVTASKPGTEVCTAAEVLAYGEKLQPERIW